MFADKLDTEQLEPFFFALKCAVHVYCDKVITSNNDFLGTVFYGTNKKKNQFDFENVYIYHDLDNPEASRIKELEELICMFIIPFTRL